MLFKEPQLDGIRRGTTTRTFRRWSSPRVRVGGVYRLRPDVAVRVTAVRPWLRPLTPRDARAAGFESVERLERALGRGRGDAPLYRVDFARCEVPEDTRAAVARSTLTNEAFEGLRTRLAAMDRRTRTGAWTSRVLSLIDDHPGRRAADLATCMSWPTPDFKARVRRLKALGLTESLEVGYRLSPRGRSYVLTSRRGTST